MLLSVMPQERVTTYAWDTKYDLQNGTDGINPGLIRLAHGCQFLLGFIHLRLKGIQTLLSSCHCSSCWRYLRTENVRPLRAGHRS